LCYVVLLSCLNEVAGLPLGFYAGFLLERRYDQSNQTIGAWLTDQAKSFGIGLVLGCAAVGLLYWLIRLSPDRWWLTAGAAFTLVIIGLTNLAPVVLLPLFYPVKPLDRDALRTRLLALAERAGARVLGAYEWGLGSKTKKANAALAGLGGTRRILVSDTMLAEYSDDEIEVVLAHEIAHHVHGDIWKGIVFESGLILAGFYLASQVLRVMAGPAGLRGVDDVGGLGPLDAGRRLADVPLRPLAFQFQSLRVADRKTQRRVTRCELGHRPCRSDGRCPDDLGWRGLRRDLGRKFLRHRYPDGLGPLEHICRPRRGSSSYVLHGRGRRDFRHSLGFASFSNVLGRSVTLAHPDPAIIPPPQ